MANLFTTILNMSLTASIIIGIVLLARLCLKKAPKIFSYVLWAVVLFRLLCPVSIILPVSVLAPMSEASTSAGTSYTASMEYISMPDRADDSNTQAQQPVPGENIENDNANEFAVTVPNADTSAVVVEQQMSAREIALTVLGWIWVAGMISVLGVTAWQTFSLKRRLADACIIRGNIFESDKIDTAFILGVFNPKIYLPLGLPFDIQKAVVAHEQTHQRRGDHIVKLVSYIALAIHWFNPLVWLSFKLMCDDMEKSCDETVIRTMNKRGYTEKSVKKAYSNMLFSFGYGKQNIFSPVSFAEHSTKERIVNVANYSQLTKPVIAFIVLTILVVVVVSTVNPVGALHDLTIPSSSDVDNEDTLTFAGVSFDRNVTELSLKGQQITDISALSVCSELTKLELDNNNITDISAIAGLTNLEYLSVSNNNISDISALSNLKNLKQLYIDGNPITDYSVISELDSLSTVSVNADIIESDDVNLLRRMSKLQICGETSGEINSVDVSVVQNFPHLQHFTLKNCIAEDYSAINNFAMAKDSLSMIFEMDVDDLDDYANCGLGEITEVWGLFITYEKGNSLTILDGVTEISWIRIAKRDYSEYDDDIDDSPILTLKDFSGLESCTGVTELDIVGLGKEYDLSVLSRLPKLSRLGVVGEMDAIDFVKSVPNISTLSVQGTFTDISPLSKLNQLRSLTLYGRYNDLSSLSSLSKLQHIMLSGQFTDLSGIKKLKQLESLYIISDKLEDISALAELDNVSGRTVIDSAITTDYSPIAEMDSLESIAIINSTIDNLNFIVDSNCLRSASIYDCVVNDASALSQSTGLSSLTIDGCTLTGFDEEAFRQNNESCSFEMTNTIISENDAYAGTNTDSSDTSITTDIVSISIGNRTFYSDITELDLSGEHIDDFSPLAQCTQLVSLDISETGVTDLSFLSSLTNLQNLDISDNAERVITTGPEQNSQLKTIENESVIGNLTNLRSLNISGNGLENISFVTQLPLLEYLDISRNHISDISCLESNSSLKCLYLYSNRFDNAVFPSGLTSLEELYAEGCSFADYSGLSDCAKMRILDLRSYGTVYLNDLSLLSGMKNLGYLNLKGCYDLDLNPLSSLTSLKELYVEFSVSGKDGYKFLSGMKQLKVLDISVDYTYDLSGFSELTSLEWLNLTGAGDISPLAGCKKLNQLILSFGGIDNPDISPLSELTDLQYLDLSGNTRLRDISALRTLKELVYLNLSRCSISDISALSSMDKMVYLNIESNNISDVSSLLNLDGFSNNEYIGGKNYVMHYPETDLEILYPEIYLTGNPLTNKQITELRSAVGCSVYSEWLE